MHIGILGPLLVGDGTRSVALRAKKIRVMVAMLALNPGRVVAFDELMDELWGEAPLKNARNALQANVKRLRKSLGELGLDDSEQGRVQTVDNGYLLDVPEDALDAYRFLRTAERGAALVDGRPHEAITLLRESLAMWRGPALLDASDGPRCRAMALRFDEQRRAVREDLISAQLQIGDAAAVIPELQQLLAQYPERERFSEQLMLALYRCGRQTEAIDIFHRTRRQLDLELGLKPSRRLAGLYQAILIQDPALQEQ
ncbi:SARP family transcriptional regulator [Streptomyces triticagri]|uniref:SARP family transcriptional regulator n=1 Tax=Streptomyces triticagri TaxID=2293568 RepID=A0A372LWX0_9ACTN|nr:AfsR/SARP family transcriptional regulator [Streptomyces triticagri]RFU82517.1 SARP family transcriptional regulator [Streptomyces triticagri]